MYLDASYNRVNILVTSFNYLNLTPRLNNTEHKMIQRQYEYLHALSFVIIYNFYRVFNIILQLLANFLLNEYMERRGVKNLDTVFNFIQFY
ncbi:unnamed protein product [Paramecium sonneborni]|uniref:Uncharacterized protein n=1 Tax=Paramecium sonneborni TaxID=65129 RepID=A0A8S1Q107_9CILI|nr:unnamed protein product [Paramecium sonneborni]